MDSAKIRTAAPPPESPDSNDEETELHDNVRQSNVKRAQEVPENSKELVKAKSARRDSILHSMTLLRETSIISMFILAGADTAAVGQEWDVLKLASSACGFHAIGAIHDGSTN